MIRILYENFETNRMKQNPCTFETSTGLVKKFEDISQTKGTPFVSGIKSNSTPKGRTEIVGRASGRIQFQPEMDNNPSRHIIGTIFCLTVNTRRTIKTN